MNTEGKCVQNVPETQTTSLVETQTS